MTQAARDKQLIQIGMILVGISCVLGSCSRTNEKSALFQNGRTLVMEGRYNESLSPLQEYLSEYPEGKSASRAGLFLGKAYLALDRKKDARATFAATAAHYPDSPEAHECLYKLALVDLFDNRRAEAIRRFQQLSSQPNGTLAPEATAMVRFLALRSR